MKDLTPQIYFGTHCIFVISQEQVLGMGLRADLHSGNNSGQWRLCSCSPLDLEQSRPPRLYGRGVWQTLHPCCSLVARNWCVSSCLLLASCLFLTSNSMCFLVLGAKANDKGCGVCWLGRQCHCHVVVCVRPCQPVQGRR